MTASGVFLSGVIEGFYGRPWSAGTRRAYADLLSQAGLNTCIYCPKGDPFLRKRWQQHWPGDEWRELKRLAAHYRERGLFWGVGLSPFELYRHYTARERKQLRRKLDALADLEAPILAVLFDDMPGDLADLASRQGEIVEDVCGWLPGVRILVCPTYYSFDPVLEKHFGHMPEDYWPQLGRELPAGVDVFWTGNKVCSDSVSAADIQAIQSRLGRPLLLWDNYPVNDGAVRSNYLYCHPLRDRDPAIETHLTGHLCNPMNQGWLSLPALTGLARLYGNDLPENWLSRALGEATWESLLGDRDLFATAGLSGLGESRCAELARRYEALPGEAAAEVAGWLRGDYRFDPACLTD
jgi:hypothetical protein